MSEYIQTEDIVVFITAPNEDLAVTIARSLVESRLAACANIIKGIRSIYIWQDKVEDDKEVFMIVKTRRELFERLKSKVKELHSYEVPEIIALPITAGSDDYLKWLRESTL
ncbi:MAG: divalent-cation tolerance protein CutA [Nitrospirae bacterium]|nr:divalent-cation tolerance protein CutA [Nitrospirota bacterium]